MWRTDQLVMFAFEKLERRVSGAVDALVAGTMWRKKFRQMFERHPTLNTEELPDALDGCDACHLDRKSTWRVTLLGRPYNPTTFDVSDLQYQLELR
jgi:hypothetical protein